MFSTKIDLDCFANAPKEVRHPEHREGSPAIGIVPNHGDPSLLVHDDVLLFVVLNFGKTDRERDLY